MGQARRGWLLGAVLLASLISTLPAAAQAPLIADMPWLTPHTVKQGKRQVSYFRADHGADKPTILFIQGSGCDSWFERQDDGSLEPRTNAATIILDRQDINAVLVEKPFSNDEDADRGDECSPAFIADFSADSWQAALSAVLTDVRRTLPPDAAPIMLFGHSEGADMAAYLLGADPDIGRAAIIAGGGLDILFEMTSFAYIGGGWTGVREEEAGKMSDRLRAIMNGKGRDDEILWGSSLRQWRSFLRRPPGLELLKSDASLLLVGGTRDKDASMLAMEASYALLVAGGHDVTIWRLLGADHRLMARGDRAETRRHYNQAIDWLIGRKLVVQDKGAIPANATVQ